MVVRFMKPDPHKTALIFPAHGVQLTYQELDSQADHAAAWLLSQGLNEGDGIALLLENRPEFIVLARAASTIGVYFTGISTHLAAAEVQHILVDSGAKVFIASNYTLERARQLAHANPQAVQQVACFTVDQATDGFASCADALHNWPLPAAFPERAVGREMLYSSGTTGKPKGIRKPLVPFADRHKPEPGFEQWARLFQADETMVYLSPAPLYHAAPLRYTLRVLAAGGAAVILSKFDPVTCLQAIQDHKVTHSQWVPTMFVRLLELPESTRRAFDLSSMRAAVHAAAPCPVHVKQAMLDWWGDIIHEYYAGSEVAGTTWITPREWRQRPGSVGRATMGIVHILDDNGHELPPGEVGKVYFEGAATFTYLNDPEKTGSAYNAQGWATYGDVGYVDADGFLFLSDRRDDLILSGGVNIYPFEIESVISRHPDVQDVAVVGVPDPVFGELPKAIVSLKPGIEPDQETANRLVAFASADLARIKLPRTLVFEDELPRLETGKLLRRKLKEHYRAHPEAGFPVSASGR